MTDNEACVRRAWLTGGAAGIVTLILLWALFDVMLLWALVLAVVVGGAAGAALSRLQCAPGAARAEDTTAIRTPFPASEPAPGGGAAMAAPLATVALPATPPVSETETERGTELRDPVTAPAARGGPDGAETASGLPPSTVETAAERESGASGGTAPGTPTPTATASSAAPKPVEKRSTADTARTPLPGHLSDRAAAEDGDPAAAAPPETVPPSDGSATPPPRLDAPRAGGADDLKRIRGIGPKLEELLHATGIWHFDQIAAWGPAEIAWTDANLPGFRGRVSRDDWVAQARALASAVKTGSSSDADDGPVAG